MRLRLIRHATLELDYAGQRLLVDPLLSEPRHYPSLTIGASAARNPTVPLPCPVDGLLRPDLLLVTHRHFDHFDAAARRLLPKSLPLVCQSADAARMRRQGFSDLVPISAAPRTAHGIEFQTTPGRHGRAVLGRLLGPVSSFFLRAPGEPTLCLASDTVCCASFRAALTEHQPEIVVLNAGAARFNLGHAITMDTVDIAEVCALLPKATVVVTHLEAINHCRLRRAELREWLAGNGLADRVLVPNDGETAFVS